MRSFSGPFTRNVIDVMPLSTSQIKDYLDRRPFSQEEEDRFRGVDGPKVVDHEALYNPPMEWRPPLYKSQEAFEVARQEVRRKNEVLRAERERAEKNGEAVLSCMMKISDYDLCPRVDAK